MILHVLPHNKQWRPFTGPFPSDAHRLASHCRKSLYSSFGPHNRCPFKIKGGLICFFIQNQIPLLGNECASLMAPKPRSSR